MKSSKGLTLIELMIAIVLVSLFIGAVTLLYKTGFSTFYSQGVRVSGKGGAGRALVNMAQELREATSVTDAQQTSVTFTRDTDGNGTDETIQFTWSGTAGTALNRVASCTQPVVLNVNNLSLSFYDSSNNLLSFPVTASQAKMALIDLTVKEQDETFQLRSQARFRNL